MGTIDIHTHAFPDKLAPRAIRTLESASEWQAVADGKVVSLLHSMDAAGIDVSVVCPIATSPKQVRGILRWCGKIHSDRIEPFPSVHPKVRGPDKWLARCAEAGFVGVKLHPMYQDFVFDDPAMDAIYAAAVAHGLVVATHCGRDIAYPPQDDRASPVRVARVLDRHPKLKLICTHMGGWRMWDQAVLHLLGKGVHIETSFSLALLGSRRAAEMIRRHGPDRVMMGSDWPWVSQAAEVARVRQLGLDRRATEAVLWQNAAGLLGY